MADLTVSSYVENSNHSDGVLTSFFDALSDSETTFNTHSDWNASSDNEVTEPLVVTAGSFADALSDTETTFNFTPEPIIIAADPVPVSIRTETGLSFTLPENSRPIALFLRSGSSNVILPDDNDNALYLPAGSYPANHIALISVNTAGEYNITFNQNDVTISEEIDVNEMVNLPQTDYAVSIALANDTGIVDGTSTDGRLTLLGTEGDVVTRIVANGHVLQPVNGQYVLPEGDYPVNSIQIESSSSDGKTSTSYNDNVLRIVNTAPTFTISDDTDVTLTKQPIIFTLTPNENVVGLTESDLTVTNGRIQSFVLNQDGGATVIVEPNADFKGEVTLQINAEAAQSGAGLHSLIATGSQQVDTLAPSAVSLTANQNGSVSVKLPTSADTHDYILLNFVREKDSASTEMRLTKLADGSWKSSRPDLINDIATGSTEFDLAAKLVADDTCITAQVKDLVGNTSETVSAISLAPAKAGANVFCFTLKQDYNTQTAPRWYKKLTDYDDNVVSYSLSKGATLNTAAGHDAVSAYRIEQNAKAHLGSGNDTLKTTQLYSGEILLEQGADNLILNTIQTGKINAGSGSDELFIGEINGKTDIHFGTDFAYNTNYLTVTRENIGFSGKASGSVAHLTLTGLESQDNIDIEQHLQNSTVNLGDNNDTVEIGGQMTVSHINLGAGQDTLTVNGDISHSTVTLAEGHDDVTLNGTLSHSQIDLGAGDDVIYLQQRFDADVKIYGGDGNDKLILGGDNIVIDYKNTSGIDVFDLTGSKNAVLNLTYQDLLADKESGRIVVLGNQGDKVKAEDMATKGWDFIAKDQTLDNYDGTFKVYQYGGGTYGNPLDSDNLLYVQSEIAFV